MPCGRLAQLVAQHVHIVKVGGSSPSSPKILVHNCWGKPTSIDPLSKNIVEPAHQAFVAGRRAQRLAEHLSALMPAGAVSGLDIGCGNGAVAASVQTLCPGLTFTGVETVVRGQTRIPVLPYDGSTLPFPDRSFDVSMLVDVLHHTDDPAAVLQEACRVSRQAIILKDHYCQSPFDASILRFMDWVGNKAHGVALPYNYLSRQEWTETFARAGCQAETVKEKLGLYPFPFTLLFDGTLQFVARLVPTA